jgi:hypothetical protein
MVAGVKKTNGTSARPNDQNHNGKKLFQAMEYIVPRKEQYT